jgi:alpha-N-arabinofuranosidase
MFSKYLGDKIVPVTAENIPTQNRPLTRRDSTENITPKPIPTIFYAATKDAKTGTIYLKIVNVTGKQQPVEINLKGVAKILPNATLVVIKGDKPEDTNSITEPEKIIPATTKISGMAPMFTRTFEPYSVSILQLQTQ